MSALTAKTFKDTYPIFELSLDKSNTSFENVDQIIERLAASVAAHPKATEIARFDHFQHTQSIDGEIGAQMKDAKNLVLCFGMQLPSPDPVAVRPRSIGVSETESAFVINFMQAPNPKAQEAMTEWVEALATV